MEEDIDRKVLSDYAEVKSKEHPEDFIHAEQVTVYKVTHPHSNSWEQSIEYREHSVALAIAKRAITRKAREANKEAREHKLFEIPKVKISTTHTMTIEEHGRRFNYNDQSFSSGDHENNLPFTFYAVKTGKHMQSLYDRMGYEYVYQDRVDIGTLINDTEDEKLRIRTDRTQGYKHGKTIIVAVELDNSSDNKLLRPYYTRKRSAHTLLVPLTAKYSYKCLTEKGFIDEAINNFKQLLGLDSSLLQHGMSTRLDSSVSHQTKLVTAALMLNIPYGWGVSKSNIVLPGASEKLLRIWLKKAYQFLKAPTLRAKKVDKDEEVV